MTVQACGLLLYRHVVYDCTLQADGLLLYRHVVYAKVEEVRQSSPAVTQGSP
jgi:hypothetical protein